MRHYTHPMLLPLSILISHNILLTVSHTILVMLVGRIWVGTSNNPLIDIFFIPLTFLLDNEYDIVRRNSVLFIHGN